MKRIAAAALLLAFCVPSFAQSVKLPKTASGLPGQWIVIPFETVDGGAPKVRLGPGLEFVNLAALIPDLDPNKIKGRVVVSLIPGQYTFEAWNAKGDVASDISTCIVTVVGTPPQKPPTDPAPIPTGKYFFMIVRPDDAPKKPYVDYMGNAGWDTLRAAGHSVKDYTLTESSRWGLTLPAGTALPCIVTLATQGANSVIVRGPIPLPPPSEIVNLPPK